MKALIVMLILIMPALAYSQSNNKDWPYPPMGEMEDWEPEVPMADIEIEEMKDITDSCQGVIYLTEPLNIGPIETDSDVGIEVFNNRYFAEGGSEIDNPIIIICKIDSKKDCRKLSKFLRQNKTK